MRYFDHDTTACSDSRLMALRLEHGSAAIDLYWTLLERMYADETELNLSGSNLETKSLTWLVSITQEQLESYVLTMLELGLFEGDIEHLYSERAMANITAYQQRRETARQNGKLGGRKPKQKTDKKPSRLADGNQTAKLRKEKKSIGFDKQNQILSGNGAGGGNPAPLPQKTADLINAIDAEMGIDNPFTAEQYAKTMEHRANVAAMEEAAIPCPAELNPFKAVV